MGEQVCVCTYKNVRSYKNMDTRFCIHLVSMPGWVVMGEQACVHVFVCVCACLPAHKRMDAGVCICFLAMPGGGDGLARADVGGIVQMYGHIFKVVESLELMGTPELYVGFHVTDWTTSCKCA